MRIFISTAIGFALALALFSASAIANESAVTTPNSAPSDSTTPAPILLELFTSQGCSSCPPADRLLNRLAEQEGLIVISRSVTYWDRLGWKDTLARPENDLLQRRYAALGLPGSGVYTPEMVVQGRYATVGSRARVIAVLVERARRTSAQARTATLGGWQLNDAPDQGEAAVASNAPAPRAQIKFFALASQREVAIGGGENARRRMRYSNVLLDESAHDCPATRSCIAAMPTHISTAQGADRWVAVLQNKRTGQVLAARWIRIR